MTLFRTADGRLLTRNPKNQFFVDVDDKRFYVNSDGYPVNEHGTLVFGNIVTVMHYTVDEYIKAFPQAEEYRRFLTCRRGKVAIIQSLPPWAWFCGNVVIATFYPAFTHPKDEKYSTPPCISVNDGDDSYMRQEFATNEEAEVAFTELLTLAPFIMPDLKTFGYNPE